MCLPQVPSSGEVSHSRHVKDTPISGVRFHGELQPSEWPRRRGGQLGSRLPSARLGWRVRGLLAALLVAALAAPGAQANVPPAVTNTNTIRIPADSDRADGTLTTRLTYTDTTATATAATGNTVGLGRGYPLQAHDLRGLSPQGCAARELMRGS